MILSHKEFTDKIKFIGNKGVMYLEIDKYCNGKRPITIDYDVFLPTLGINLQRDFCWTLEQKQEYILSRLKRIAVTKISIVLDDDDPKNVVMQVIDGKQRLSTLIDFYKGGFSISYQGGEYFFNDLDSVLKSHITSYDLTYDVAYDYDNGKITDQQKIDWFMIINYTGTPQEKSHFDKINKLARVKGKK